MAADSPVIVVVGGFLASGKTTLLLEAASRLIREGFRAALITNDQGGALVDTQLAQAAQFHTEEVVGGCVCCRFSDLIDAAARLRVHRPHVIFVEPVGSCIDLAATVIQPLKRLYEAEFRIAPLTVLVDAARARELLAPDAPAQMAYLFTNQIAEADLVCFSKADLYADFPELPSGVAMRLSVETGEGISEWLREVLAGTAVSGSRILDVNYTAYAEAEAALGWLNWQATLNAADPVSPAQVAGPLLDDIEGRLSAASIQIAHLKMFVDSGSGYVKASICRNSEEPFVQGNLDASPADEHKLLVNLRACGSPEVLQAIVTEATSALPGQLTVHHFECFRPSPPRPEHRIAEPHWSSK